MVKLNIINMTNFLDTVNECNGSVNLLHSDGRKENINKQYDIQKNLLQKYGRNNNYLKLSLDIPNRNDYLRIVYFTIGDC